MEFNNSIQAGTALEYPIPTVNEDGLISNYALRIIRIVNHVVLNGPICLLGIVTNIINLIIFYLLGLNNTMNISFFALAVSDLCSLITLQWGNICLTPFMERVELSFELGDVEYLTAGWPHACFGRITCWITAYMAAERCLCIAAPLKVKDIITPGRTRVVICVIYLLMFGNLSIEYVGFYFGEKFFPERNETRVGLLVYEENKAILNVTHILFAAIGFLAFTTVTVFTFILIVKLQSHRKWLSQSICHSEQSEVISSRDKKTMKMVVLIASVLIACFAPSNMMSVAAFIEPEFSVTGRYVNTYKATFWIGFLCEAVNSSINLFIYYKMGSKYRTTFRKLFVRSCKDDTKDSNNVKPTIASDKARTFSSTSHSIDAGEKSKDDVSPDHTHVILRVRSNQPP